MLWRLCIFKKFCKGCTDVSHVTGESVELTVLKEKCCCGGNKGSGTEISSCAIYL